VHKFKKTSGIYKDLSGAYTNDVNDLTAQMTENSDPKGDPILSGYSGEANTPEWTDRCLKYAEGAVVEIVVPVLFDLSYTSKFLR